jgi:hypothetical protein
MTKKQRFEVKAIPDANGCWIWKASIFPTSGYGQFRIEGHPDALAHRWAWRIYRGEIPEGLLVLHKCDVRACVNPDHLFLGTRRENVDDMLKKGRQASRERAGHARFTLAQVEEMRRQYLSGASQKEIGTRFGTAQGAIGRIIRGERWGLNPISTAGRGPRGEKSGSSKLTAEKVGQIRVRAANGETQASLGLEYGVSQVAIGCVIRRKTWKQINQPSPDMRLIWDSKTGWKQ